MFPEATNAPVTVLYDVTVIPDPTPVPLIIEPTIARPVNVDVFNEDIHIEKQEIQHQIPYTLHTWNDVKDYTFKDSNNINSTTFKLIDFINYQNLIANAIKSEDYKTSTNYNSFSQTTITRETLAFHYQNIDLKLFFLNQIFLQLYLIYQHLTI